MTDTVDVRSGVYHDSVTLMQVSQQVRTTPGVTDALIGMGTELNLGLMRDGGFDVPGAAGPNDLVVALRGSDEGALGAGLARLEEVFAELRARSRRTGTAEEVAPRTVGSAAARSGANLALISTPGRHAVADALDAVRSGLSVMLFSDNVSVEDEIRLKDAAAAADVLVMGPDCGTAVVGGAYLGFANVTRPGRFGVVAASGTGAQQVMCLLDLAGEGVSHVLGLGGRDLSDAVGGRSAKQALRALAADEATEHVIIVSKPASPAVVEELTALAGELGVGVSWATLGRGLPDLTAATEVALTAAGGTVPEWPWWAAVEPRPAGEPGQGEHLRGLYCGGTLADEAMIITEEQLGPIASNIPLEGSPQVSGHEPLTGHAVIDFGDDELTQGRAHPMIDPSLRLEKIREQGTDATCGVLLLDLVLGHGSHPDPARELADAVSAARSAAREDGRQLPVVVALVGTESDPQGLKACAATLSQAGAQVHTSHAQAVRTALQLLARP
ncbi:FdrA family protein [Ornithinimicrobium avium]|uniref:FdrA family protein n=1 Tax=Ornithinimicrobium avium TaxID=2283195 RepID=UPI001D186D42|nr:FdrA family protein [Ornithinimicrobium avium]